MIMGGSVNTLNKNNIWEIKINQETHSQRVEHIMEEIDLEQEATNKSFSFSKKKYAMKNSQSQPGNSL